MKIEHLIILDMLPKNLVVKNIKEFYKKHAFELDVEFEDLTAKLIIYSETYNHYRWRQVFPSDAVMTLHSYTDTEILLTNGKWLFDEKDTRLWNEIWPESKHFEIIEYIE